MEVFSGFFLKDIEMHYINIGIRSFYGLLIVAILASCGGSSKNVLPNTKEYAEAHGIRAGQPNNISVGNVKLHFPEGTGINPLTYSKNPEEIIKGKADKVSFYLDLDKGYTPISHQFPTGRYITIEISKEYGVSDFKKDLKNMEVRIDDKHKLKEYFYKNGGETYYAGLITDLKDPNGNPILFRCQSQPKEMSNSSGLCFTNYYIQKNGHRAGVRITIGKSHFLSEWNKAFPTVVDFVSSIIVD